MTLQTLASIDKEIQQLSGQLYDTVKHEMAIQADGKQRAEGQKEGLRQENARKESGQDTAGQFETDLLAGGANSTLSAGLQIVGTAREAIGNSDPGVHGDNETIESSTRSRMYDEGVRNNDSFALGDMGLGMRRIETDGEFPITYATDNVGASLNSTFTGASSSIQDVEATMETTIQLTRTLNFGIQRELGNAQRAEAELQAQLAQAPSFGGPGGMNHNKLGQGPKGYTPKQKENESATDTNWA